MMIRTRDDSLIFLSDVTSEDLQTLTSICSTLNDPMPATHHTPSTEEGSVFLPVDFTPSKHSVIAGRGKEAKQNMGNKRLRELASKFLPQYANATDKHSKSLILSSIVQMVHNTCPEGGAFVKHSKSGLWYQVNDAVAREKVGYIFRDLLCDRYRSSSKSKVARRHKELKCQATMTLERASSMTYSMEPIPVLVESDMEPLDVPIIIEIDMEPLDVRQEYALSHVSEKHLVDEIDLQDLLSSPLFQ
jgi:hypothetical protein